MDRPKNWLRAGGFLFDVGWIKWINTQARWTEPAEDAPRDAWGEARPGHEVERRGVEVLCDFFRTDNAPFRFPDGSPEAEDLRRFVQSFSRPSQSGAMEHRRDLPAS